MRAGLPPPSMRSGSPPEMPAPRSAMSVRMPVARAKRSPKLENVGRASAMSALQQVLHDERDAVAQRIDAWHAHARGSRLLVFDGGRPRHLRRVDAHAHAARLRIREARGLDVPG